MVHDLFIICLCVGILPKGLEGYNSGLSPIYNNKDNMENPYTKIKWKDKKKYR